jgi:hypothetical protein
VKQRKTTPGKSSRSAEASARSGKPVPRDQLPAHRVRRSSPANVDLVVKHYHRDESSGALSEGKRLFLRVGDEVSHLHYEQWGIGVVMEVMTSSVPGGTCLARVRFQDGQLRCFNNDLDNEGCCYYFGLRRYWNASHGVNAIRTKFFLRG